MAETYKTEKRRQGDIASAPRVATSLAERVLFYARESRLRQLAALTRIPSNVSMASCACILIEIRFVAIRALRSWLLPWRLPRQQKRFFQRAITQKLRISLKIK